MDTWQRLFGAVDRRLLVDASRDPQQEPADAGHLAIQELLLGLGREIGYSRSFELPTTPAATRHSVDVALRDDRRRLLVLLEAWNVFGDIGAASRSTTRKVADAEALAVAIGGARPYRVASCWVVRATARNQALVARYPELFASRFPGSSIAWVKALTEGAEPPPEPGLVWCDLFAKRLYAWRAPRDPPLITPRRSLYHVHVCHPTACHHVHS